MIGDKIHKIRKKKGLTLSELAERANMSKSYLSNIERNLNDNPSIQVVERIAAVLNVDLHTLIEIKHEPSHFLESEWLHFVNELKKLGIRKEQLPEYKAIIEFIKWQNEKVENRND
ncbi:MULTISPECIES: helix-turn-helix domain-containing protein [Priestia]|uniref:Helix-turn-helix transcriptional regulator n=1 Tax=Priestia aryabhattai TaxID=412384 RepID=A0ABD5KSS1_PRIAR|nr:MULTISPECIES: helix-turn-helix transcriptional regulator [Priestia]MBK0292115.1 helix-turn-helix transcriptional regulator [Bacillus sp. S34]UPK48077.1 helix-turn-helix domain-containing protein [Bacillus sp. H8-1]MDC7764045.1 helix-turn-helix transcriptional regulator [Priestia aryabhattai]MEB4886003.1 helix-turn-helix transcriptional regulator [Priestia megaterium]MED5118438.1 helix-turn-helix transcriptional regulator [Priestia megaterium]